MQYAKLPTFTGDIQVDRHLVDSEFMDGEVSSAKSAADTDIIRTVTSGNTAR